MYKKISIVAYLNMITVVLVSVLHEQIEAMSHFVILVILMVYAFLNGIYIQWELGKQKRLQGGLKTERQFSTLILESIPSGIVIVSPSGIIEYVNNAIGTILGSTETAGLNILEFDTIRKISLDKRIEQAIKGKASTMRNVEYTSYTSRENKVLNFTVKPFEYNDSLQRYSVILMIDDITESNHLQKRIDAQYLSMFKSFAKFIDAKDTYTGKHSNNVSFFTELMLMEMALSESEKRDIRIAAALHDIGKIGIRESILNKPGKLTKEEYEEMKRHPVIGAELLGEIEDYKAIANIIRHHHEWWNGKGYPDGIKETAIPLGSQIIAIADAYDAITSDRVYRKGRSQNVAIGILNEQKWTQFNGELVDRFIDLIVAHEELTVELG